MCVCVSVFVVVDYYYYYFLGGANFDTCSYIWTGKRSSVYIGVHVESPTSGFAWEQRDPEKCRYPLFF